MYLFRLLDLPVIHRSEAQSLVTYLLSWRRAVKLQGGYPFWEVMAINDLILTHQYPLANSSHRPNIRNNISQDL